MAQVVETMFVDKIKRTFLKRIARLDQVQEIFSKIEANTNAGQGSRIILQREGDNPYQADDIWIDQELDPNNTTYCKN